MKSRKNQNVKIISPQPPPRIDSFRTNGVSSEKKRFLGQVDKYLCIRYLYHFRFEEANPSLSNGCRSYRHGACIQQGWSLHSTRMELSFNLKEDSISIGTSARRLLFLSNFAVLPHFYPTSALSFVNSHCPDFLLFVNIIQHSLKVATSTDYRFMLISPIDASGANTSRSTLVHIPGIRP